MSLEQPLDLYDLLVNTVSGSIEVFVFLSMIFISGLSARFHLPKSIFLVMISLFGIMLSEFVGGIYLIIILLSGFIIFSALAKVFQ